MIPSSTTRFVEANSNAIAARKSPPLRKIERASATAAYEHDEDAAPRRVAIVRLRAPASGRRRVISALDTTAWTTAERRNPRISAQVISQAMPKANDSARRTASMAGIRD